MCVSNIEVDLFIRSFRNHCRCHYVHYKISLFTLIHEVSGVEVHYGMYNVGNTRYQVHV